MLKPFFKSILISLIALVGFKAHATDPDEVRRILENGKNPFVILNLDVDAIQALEKPEGSDWVLKQRARTAMAQIAMTYHTDHGTELALSQMIISAVTEAKKAIYDYGYEAAAGRTSKVVGGDSSSEFHPQYTQDIVSDYLKAITLTYLSNSQSPFKLGQLLDQDLRKFSGRLTDEQFSRAWQEAFLSLKGSFEIDWPIGGDAETAPRKIITGIINFARTTTRVSDAKRIEILIGADQLAANYVARGPVQRELRKYAHDSIVALDPASAEEYAQMQKTSVGNRALDICNAILGPVLRLTARNPIKLTIGAIILYQYFSH